jgi:hypothetical protein
MRPIPDASTFTSIREAYLQAKADSDDPHDVLLRKALDRNHSGAIASLEIREAQGKGRGLYVTKLAPKGSAIYNANLHGIFSKESEWRTFLSLLPENLVYDVVIWSYVLDWGDDMEVAALDLDEGSLMNHGGGPMMEFGVSVINDKGKPANLVCESNGEIWQYKAVEDIQANEELLCDYDGFHEDDHSLDWYRESCKEVLDKHSLK